MSNEQFDLADYYIDDEDDDEDEGTPFFSALLPFHQSRIVSHTPEILGPFYKSDDVGRMVRVHGGIFHILAPDMAETFEEELGDFVGEILAMQHGRIIVYDSHCEVFIGWLTPDEYEFIAPFNTDINISWTQ